jgi:hypothetical protein
MKQLFLFIFVAIISFSTRAQVNIFSGLPMSDGWTMNTFCEAGNYYFYLTQKIYSNVYHNSGTDYAATYILHKVDKLNFTEVSSVTALGDSTQADSTVASFFVFLKENKGRLYIAYGKKFVYDTTLIMYKQFRYGVYCKVYDTVLNVVVPEKRLCLYTGDEEFTGANLRTFSVINEKPIISFSQLDTLASYKGMSRFILLDKDANVLKEDTAGYKPRLQYFPAYTLTDLINVNSYKNKQIIASGRFLCSTELDGFYLADSNMNVLDTFYLLNSDYNKFPVANGYFPSAPSMAALPTGSLVFAGMFSYTLKPSNQGYMTTAFTKNSEASRFGVDTLVIVDGNHGVHSSSNVPVTALAYNATDNNLYYSNSVDMDNFGEYCAGTSNYIQLICADTNLHVKWVKYIYSDSNICAISRGLSNCDGRPGTVIVGTKTSQTVPAGSFVNSYAYYIDSTGYLAVPETEGVHIRDRFRLYPNPVADMVYADDVFNSLKEACVYDMQGRVVVKQALGSGSNGINVSSLPPGIYLVRLYTTDEQVYTSKFFKQ